MPWHHSKRRTLAFHLRSPRKRSNSFSARIFSQVLTWRSLTSLSYLPPTCLHSHFHYQTPANSKCHLPSTITKTTPGRFSMGRRSEPPRPSCWKVRSDLPTGLTTRTTPDVICPPLELSTLAERFQIMTPFPIGRPKKSWIPSRRTGKDNKTLSSGRCIEVLANIRPSKLGMKWHSSPWLKEEWQQRQRSTRLPTANMSG